MVGRVFGNMSLVLAGSQEEGETIPINCAFPADANDEVKGVAQGQRIRIKGACDGIFEGEVSVSSCVLLDAVPEN